MLDRVHPPVDRNREVVIRVRGVEVGFGEKTILKGLDLDVYRGEILGFVGASGQGKSVLTRTILGLLPKKSGTIEVLGQDIDGLTPSEQSAIGRRLGVLFQQTGNDAAIQKPRPSFERRSSGHHQDGSFAIQRDAPDAQHLRIGGAYDHDSSVKKKLAVAVAIGASGSPSCTSQRVKATLRVI